MNNLPFKSVNTLAYTKATNLLHIFPSAPHHSSYKLVAECPSGIEMLQASQGTFFVSIEGTSNGLIPERGRAQHCITQGNVKQSRPQNHCDGE